MGALRTPTRGKPARHKLPTGLAIHQLSELSVLLVGKAMDQHTPRT
ncbi:hypothetical protein GIV46_13575 [Pseudomonas poae]|uniref:Uncharacterized protein n=1 Tax=Pseudomonas poae TaxID=200451 RepID=A0AAP2WJI0_9PSED|nr:hypothetical protein [Pseudomonas poae]